MGHAAHHPFLPSHHHPSAQAFLEYYYSLFGSNRAGLANLYQDQSMFTFEGAKCQGPAAIMAKLTSLPFNQCKITPASMDFQPSISGGIIVFVTGHVQVLLLLLLLSWWWWRCGGVCGVCLAIANLVAAGG